MEVIKRHPLYSTADAFKRAFGSNGFVLCDGGNIAELMTAEQASLSVFAMPESEKAEPITIAGSSYVLQPSLLSTRLEKMKGALPLRAITCGRVYDRRDEAYPTRFKIEGILAAGELPRCDLDGLWNSIVREALGIAYRAELRAEGRDMFRIVAVSAEKEIDLGCLGAAQWVAKAILGTPAGAAVYGFALECDRIAMAIMNIETRAALYTPLLSELCKYEGAAPVCGFGFEGKAADILRAKGFVEICGDKLYAEDCYKKMNMFQGKWDTNNQPALLEKPLNGRDGMTLVGLPTVLAPALEEALSANFKAGEESCRIFEIGHIFKPVPGQDALTDKMNLSIGAYGPGMNKISFLMLVKSVLDELGIGTYVTLPSDRAIAYDQTECFLLLSGKMAYMEGNFGGISPIARKNHGIEVPAYMAQLELAPLQKAAETIYGFIPNELK